MIRVNELQFDNVFEAIFAWYKENRGIFALYPAKVFGPQHVSFPKKVEEGSKEHLYWLALIALSDKRTSSTFLYRNFANMYDRNPRLFRREARPTLRRMRQLFRTYEIALPHKEVEFFLTRKHHLDEFFGGDPFEIYEGVKGTAELLKKLRKVGKEHGVSNVFPGSKGKIFCLLAMFLREFKDLSFENIVPVDSWVQAISTSTGVLEGRGNIKAQQLEKLLSPLMKEVFRKYEGVKGAANATWILGKFGCKTCKHIDTKGLCPVYDICKGPFKRARHHSSNKHLGVIQLPPVFMQKCTERNLND